VTTGILALLVLAAAISGRPTAVFLAAATLLLAAPGLGREADPDRPAVLLAALGLFLLLVPEIVYVRDPYGEALHRMNTVFKAYIQAWPLLGLAAPVLLGRWLRTQRARALAVAGLLLAVAPQTWAVLQAPLAARPLGIDGLAWMEPGDREAVRVLRRQRPGTVLAEAPGGAYCHEGRLSAASGVPAVLGWENHERVWRGPSIGPELDRRKAALDALYGSGEEAAVRRVASEYGIGVVVVGAIERKRYPEAGIRAVLDAGPHLLDGETVLVDVGGAS